MSYCRWSSEDFTCDVYVYDSVQGWNTHVASVRLIADEPFPPPISPVPSSDIDAWWKDYLAREQKVGEILDRARREPISLPHAGQSFLDDSPGACADTLQMLADLGHNVPAHVIADLREEQTELDSSR